MERLLITYFLQGFSYSIMRYVSLLLLLSCLLSTGCVHTKSKMKEVEPGTSYRSLHKKLRKRTAVIELRDATVYTGKIIQVNADSTSWRDKETNESHQISTSEIRSIKVSYYGRAAAIGAGIGLLAGGVLGAVMEKNCDENAYIDFRCAGITPVAIFGTLTGALIGAAKIIEVEYVLDPRPPE